MTHAQHHPTLINGIPAHHLAAINSIHEDHDRRHKFDGREGSAAEGIAALNRLFPRITPRGVAAS